jgi:hypothetical protein
LNILGLIKQLLSLCKKYCKIERKSMGETTAANGRFGAMAAVPRRQFCGKLHVIIPQQVQWKPPLRQAAASLYATRRTAPCKLKGRLTETNLTTKRKIKIFFKILSKSNKKWYFCKK